MKKPACSIHMIHAADAPIAVVLRRGSDDWTHLSLLNTETDTLTHGAWFNGRVFENCCDLSPDGELFLFKALPSTKLKRAPRRKKTPAPKPPQDETRFLPGIETDMEMRGAWTAVSRPPWLQPLVLWPHGNPWDGGGFFTQPRKLTILARHELPPEKAPGVPPLDVSFTYDTPHPGPTNSGRCCRDLNGNLLSARDGKIYRQIRWQCGKEIEIADLSKLKHGPDDVASVTKSTPLKLG